MQSNRVNLRLLFKLLSKDHPFCKKCTAQASQGGDCMQSTDSVRAAVSSQGWSRLTLTGDQGAEATNAVPHNTLDSAALPRVPDVRLQDPGGVRADDTLVHSHIF